MSLRDIKPSELAKLSGVNEGAISQYRKGSYKAGQRSLEKLAAVLRVSIPWLMGADVPMEEDVPSVPNNRTPLPSPRIATDVVSFPIITSVAAHYDSMSFNESGVEGDIVEIPEKYLRGRPASDYCVMRVKGDSMYPDFRDGDLVLVLLQATLNRPRDIGVIAYGDDEMTIKRIDYVMGEDWLELIPINPIYPPKRIENAELERCRVIGIPKLLIREL
jgi:SOS-response transcriptional repressor LexA